MPNFTKKAIKETFVALLEERPLNRITVKDIVEACGINRNSFYYHFQDLPALLVELGRAAAAQGQSWAQWSETHREDLNAIVAKYA